MELPYNGAVMPTAGPAPVATATAAQTRIGGEFAPVQVQAPAETDTSAVDAITENTVEALLNIGKELLLPKIAKKNQEEFAKGAFRGGTVDGFKAVMDEQPAMSRIFGPGASAQGAMMARSMRATAEIMHDLRLQIPSLLASTSPQDAMDVLTKKAADLFDTYKTGDAGVDGAIWQKVTEDTYALAMGFSSELVKKNQEDMRREVTRGAAIGLELYNSVASKAATGEATDLERVTTAGNVLAALEQLPGEDDKSHKTRVAELYTLSLHKGHFASADLMESQPDLFDPDVLPVLQSRREGYEKDFILGKEKDDKLPWADYKMKLYKLADDGASDEVIKQMANSFNDEFRKQHGIKQDWLSPDAILTLRKQGESARDAIAAANRAAREKAAKEAADRQEKSYRADRQARLLQASVTGSPVVKGSGSVQPWDLAGTEDFPEELVSSAVYTGNPMLGVRGIKDYLASPSAEARKLGARRVYEWAVRGNWVPAGLKQDVLWWTTPAADGAGPTGDFNLAYSLYANLASNFGTEKATAAFAKMSDNDTARKMQAYFSATSNDVMDKEVAFKQFFSDGPMLDKKAAKAATKVVTSAPDSPTGKLKELNTWLVNSPWAWLVAPGKVAARVADDGSRALKESALTELTRELAKEPGYNVNPEAARQAVMHRGQQLGTDWVTGTGAYKSIASETGASQGEVNLAWEAMVNTLKERFKWEPEDYSVMELGNGDLLLAPTPSGDPDRKFRPITIKRADIVKAVKAKIEKPAPARLKMDQLDKLIDKPKVPAASWLKDN